MYTFISGYISGLISIIAIGIFIWTVRRGKKDSSGTLKERINRNNTDIRSGIDELRDNNKKLEGISQESLGTAERGLESIKDTRRSVSKIIAAARRKGNSDD